MSKRRKSSGADISGWDWLRGLARAHGIDLTQTSLARAAGLLISQLEQCRASGRPLPPEAVRLASRLIRLQGELVEPDASPDPLVERIYARERAKLLARQLERGPLIEPKPNIGEPEEPEQPETVTLLDLIRMFDLARPKARLFPDRSRPEEPFQSHSFRFSRTNWCSSRSN